MGEIVGRGVAMETSFSVVTGRNMHAKEVGNIRRDFLCNGCQTRVSFVRGHVRNGEDPDLKRTVPPYFRLSQNAEHAPTCKYLPKSQVMALVAISRAVEDLENPFVELLEGEKYQFRINIPDELSSELKIRTKGTTSYNEIVKRIWTGRRISTYCRSAVGLAKIWHEIEGRGSQSELSEMVEIASNRQKIRWLDFFFGRKRYDQLVKKISSKNQGQRLAAAVQIKELIMNQEGSCLAKCVPIEADQTNSTSYVGINIYGKENLISSFDKGENYIVFGDWWRQKDNEWKPKNANWTRSYINLGIKVYQPAQFAKTSKF